MSENSTGGNGITTEKILQTAFDFQKFSNNPRLQSLIDEVHQRNSDGALSDDAMDHVAAAGLPEPPKEQGKVSGL